MRAQEEIAQQIRQLRERQGLRQVDLAKKAKMKQSAVSRIEQAGYSAWTFKTLLRVADALDAQLRVVFEAADDVIARYAREEQEHITSQESFGSQELAATHAQFNVCSVFRSRPTFGASPVLGQQLSGDPIAELQHQQSAAAFPPSYFRRQEALPQ
jgi:transcriptional regulator with XRE-family HTH domain